MKHLALSVVVLCSAAMPALSSPGAAGSAGTTSPATHVHMPVVAGWAAPVAALFEDAGSVDRRGAEFGEPYPVGVALWADGTVVWSLDATGFRAPYAMGRVPEPVAAEFRRSLESLRVFDAPDAAACGTDEAGGVFFSCALDGRPAFHRSPAGPDAPRDAETRARWDRIVAAIRELPGRAASDGTTAALCFDRRCVVAAQAAPETGGRGVLPVEVRAVWCTSTDFVRTPPNKQDATLERLSAAGFNTVYVMAQARGGVTYSGAVRPPHGSLVGDMEPRVLDPLVGAIRSRGMRSEAWIETGFLVPGGDAGIPAGAAAHGDDPPHVARSGEGWDHVVTEDGVSRKSLCPADPATHRLLIDIHSAMLRRFRFDGVSLNGIWFPDAEYCHCDHCRKRFAADTGTPPAVFAEGSAQWAAWMEWRKARLTDFVRSFSQEIRAEFPGRTITVCAVPPDESDEKGQDWPAWLEEGLVDAVVPLLRNGRDMALDIAAIRERMPDQRRVVYGLLPVEGVGAEICAIRQAGGRGYAVWHVGTLTPAARDEVGAANTGFGPGPPTPRR